MLVELPRLKMLSIWDAGGTGPKAASASNS